MYSDAAKMDALAQPGDELTPNASDPWERFPISEISHHGAACCELAREWVSAMDFAQLNGANIASGPRWLRARYQWGPSAWPADWCELVGEKVIDCGAHSALAQEVFNSRGLTAFRAQFVQRYDDEAIRQWRQKWTEEHVSDHWLSEDAIYHEGNAVLTSDGEIKLWDGSAGSWMNPRQGGGYGSIVAVRIFAPSRTDAFRWGDYSIVPNRWQNLESHRDCAPKLPTAAVLIAKMQQHSSPQGSRIIHTD
jgi:hypothetical protein